MTNLVTVLGSAGGVALLAVMAIVPLLLDLPRRRPTPVVPLPRQRTSEPAPARTAQPLAHRVERQVLPQAPRRTQEWSRATATR
ncbi:hypothetical protein [Pseudonocardia abyssalis]|jgi:hypothetical protein|uniref:Uncharacterized protein n=1 Tax=Pseudonocardia abyssalis TaxID=2792008 RepID=A0ABS6UNL7_9PSEU|nr:hypothetical protein [Pseudonocardia abyssalis]MBW0133498.1 hypothetical protein [Pseudonocardia abyssalis]